MSQQKPWLLTKKEWQRLGTILTSDGDASFEVRDRAAAEVCLYRFYDQRSERYRSFGWNEIPDKRGISPSTANRRYREWMESGAWITFWDALLHVRHGKQPAPPRIRHAKSESPMKAVVAELERAYRFFNHRFFGGLLPEDIVISVEPGSMRGYFCGQQWTRGKRSMGHLAVCASQLGKGAETAIEVLLHEMVHVRNDQFGLEDTNAKTQYHNRLFRDVAAIVGLDCRDRRPDRGYAFTRLSGRGKKAIADLAPTDKVFRWKHGGRRDALIG